ncbi:MAG TPA: Crp/Fnr family transcriptional regulator [Acidobacteriota bacterium]|jgi:CRP-like cAMP-binding protein|nr:Crp/Fnr family transcriptional regulator [Acidobacteriota bacterium]
MALQRDEVTEILGTVRLFRDLTREQLADVAAAAGLVKKEPGRTFFMQGAEARYLYVVLKGRVKISRITPEGHQIVVRYAGAGDLFGCVPLYGGSEYPATGEAVTASEALSWNRMTMDRLMRSCSPIALNALELLGQELSDIRSRYQELVTEKVERRVARALLRLINQSSRKVDAGILIDFPLSRQDLAEITGTTLHTVSRILSAWEQRGIVASGRRKIVISRPRALLSIAEDLSEEAL